MNDGVIINGDRLMKNYYQHYLTKILFNDFVKAGFYFGTEEEFGNDCIVNVNDNNKYLVLYMDDNVPCITGIADVHETLMIYTDQAKIIPIEYISEAFSNEYEYQTEFFM